MDTLQTVLIYVGAAITGASLIVKGIAVVTDITPGTRDDEILSTAGRYLQIAQTVLGKLSLDASPQAKK